MYFLEIGYLSVIALLSDRSSEIYKELFSTLSQHAFLLGLRFRPDITTIDFEQAIIKTIAGEVNILVHLFSISVFANFSFPTHVMLAVISISPTLSLKNSIA